MTPDPVSKAVTAAAPIVAIEELRKSFGDTEVLRGIDLNVVKGEAVVIVGSSGSEQVDLPALHQSPRGADGRHDPHRRRNGDGSEGRSPACCAAASGMVFQSINLYPHKTALGNA